MFTFFLCLLHMCVGMLVRATESEPAHVYGKLGQNPLTHL